MKTKRGNFTANRGNGAARARIVITAPEGKALERLMQARHNISATEAILMLLSGEVATVLLDSDERWALIAWLEHVNAPPSVADAVAVMAGALRAAAEQEQALEQEQE